MSIEVVMPQMGESIAEGTLVRWLKQVGDKVQRDEPLFEISTDKVDTEIPSPGDGVLSEIKVQEGETVAVQTVVALLSADGAGNGGARSGGDSREEDEDEDDIEAASAAETPARDRSSDEPRSTGSPPPGDDGDAPESSPKSGAERPPRGHRRSSPLVRRIAREHQIDLDTVEGTGSNGRVTKRDIMAVVESRESQPAEPGSPGTTTAPATAAASVVGGEVPRHPFSAEDITVEPMSTMRQRIAERMVLSKQVAPHVTTVHEVDMTEVARTIKRHKEEFLRVTGAKLTYLPFIIKAVNSALRKYPVINACIVDREIHYFKRIHIGIAVAVENGLLVPVVQDTDEKSIVGLARAIRDVAERSRARKIQPDELQGGTFTISNYGVFGSVFATPVINQPQAAILGVGAVVKRPVVLPETDAIAVRSTSYFSLSFDHRLIDGAVADQFLAHVREVLERSPYHPMES